MRVDEFFERQPEPKFIEWLKSPMHEKCPDAFAEREPSEGEVSAVGAYIAEVEKSWQDTLATATDDFTRFLCACGVLGEDYPIRIVKEDGFGEECYKISVGKSECTIYAQDSEGARRGIFYLEEEMIKREWALLPLGDILRTSHIKRRITRGFFSPTNRAPKWGDELLDDVDYYPDGYLNRLAHNGTNGLWIYTSFGQLISSPYIKSKDDNCERRMQKLSEVVKKCKRYGIRVYLFAIEPAGLLKEERALHEDMLGAKTGTERQPLCPRLDKTRAHIIYCLEHIYRAIPDLAGYITIPAGERPSTCASVSSYKSCPRCAKYSRGENLAYSIDVIKEGLRRAGTGAEFISWTYGHRYWDDTDICEYIEKAPTDAVIMQNFEDKGVNYQLGKPRVAWDYWLSYRGPSDMFSLSAKAAKKRGVPVYAKMQVCSSHEMATLPYIPAPGILFDKYKRATALGVTGIMECWYFGNYPSLMNRASTELSYIENYTDKKAFLFELAARIYGKTRAGELARAWEIFESAYECYPTNIMFSYYGPLHDGVVWELFPIPVNRALPRTWLLLDAPDGDRIGECLFKGHTLDEAITLLSAMCERWSEGADLLPLSENDEHSTCARAIQILFKSGKNILSFYKKREMLGTGEGDPWALVTEMEGIVALEIENSEKMLALCELDPRIGYHSEAEGFKFFPEKLRSRIAKLEALYDTDFREIRSRLLDGKHPLACYYAEGEEFYPLGSQSENFRWEEIDENKRFGAYIDGECVKLPIICGEGDTVSVCFEFSLFHPESTVEFSKDKGLQLGYCVLSHQSVYGDLVGEELSKYSLESKYENGLAHYLLTAAIPDTQNKKCAIRLKIAINGKSWKTDPAPVITLGKSNLSPGDFGVLLPTEA